MEILRDPMWQFIGAVLALLAIILTLYLFWLQRQRKSLSYDVISSTSLVSVNEAIKDSLQIFRNGKLIPGVHLLVVKLTNSGNIPIPSADYESPVILTFAGDDVVLEAEIMLTHPNNVKASLEFNESEVKLSPSLLNPGDTIEMKILLSKFSGKVNVDARVLGIKQLQEGKGIPNYDLVSSMMMVSSFMACIAGLFFLKTIASSIINENFGGLLERRFYDKLSLGVLLHYFLILAFYRHGRKRFKKLTQVI
jgi:hypothetical protein